MYMAPTRTPGMPAAIGGRDCSVRFPIGLSVLFAASAGLSFALLDSQPPAVFQFRAALKLAPQVQAAVDRADDANAGGAHALWTGSTAGAGPHRPQAGGASTAAIPQRELLAQSRAVNNIVPAGGATSKTGAQPGNTVDDPGQGPSAKSGAKAASDPNVNLLPTKRPYRKLAMRDAPGKSTESKTSVRRRGGGSGATADLIGPYRIQVGSYRTPEAAHAEWVNLRRLHADIFAGYIMVIEKVHRGRGGVVYRLQAGPLRSRSAVSRICSRLSKRRIGCSLVDG